jgi:8-oxo-dGTP pyrophosphatase MutT (NUDIX family)
MGWNPEVTVAAVAPRLIRGEQHFLVVEERVGGRLVFNQPAGHLEDRETLVEAVVRETREETAWRLSPEALVGIYLWRNPANGRGFLRFAFCGTVDDHRPSQQLDTGIVRALWLSRDRLQAQPHRLRSPLVMRCVEDFLAGKRQPLDTVASLDLETAPQVDSVINL